MKKIIIFFTKVFICVFAVLLVCFYFIYKYCEKKLPTLDSLLNLNENKIEILYSNSISKIKVYSNNVGNVEYSEIPQDLINALIATEDRKFFKHNGIDYFGILRAFIVNITSGSIKQGGSTITQQLAKMALNDSSKTLSRKFKEFILAKKIEKNLTKENILSLYLSKAYFGAGNYGIKSAAKFYFDKELYELKLEECAMLVGLLKAPSIYNPTNNEDLNINISVSKKGGHIVYMNTNREVNTEIISQEEANQKGKDFLTSKGFPNMKETYFLKQEGIVTINYAYMQDNVIMYPDLIKVKVALDNGEILGIETTGYLNNHIENRNISNIKITEEEAKKDLNTDLEIISSGLAVIPTEWKSEILCYEFKGKVDDREFLVYINAENGREEDILIITNAIPGASAVEGIAYISYILLKSK